MKKRTVLLIYGEKTVQINKRIPASKREEIEDKFNAILKEYENPQRVVIDIYDSSKKVILEDEVGQFVKPSVKNQITIPANSLKEGDVIEFSAEAELVPENSTASGNDKWKDVRATDEEVAEVLGNIKVTPAVKFEQIASLPLGTELLESFGSKGALRTLNDEEYFTKRTHSGKLEILKHENYESAVLYANENFK